MSDAPVPVPVKAGDHVYLIDGSTYIFRAYYALPGLERKSDGLPVGAVAGFCNMLNKLLRDSRDDDAPTHLAVILDYSAKSFRNEFYPEYKAHRPDPPEDLRPQFGLIRHAVRAFNVPAIEMEGYEADDLIATYARQAAEAGATVRIISSDKDLMQLVNDQIQMLDTMKDKKIGHAEVVEKFGVGPEKVIDVQSLAGDSVDNVPGVPGIGIKTAAQLIEEYGDLDTLLEKADGIKQKKRRENLIEFADQARVSRDLVTLKQDVPVEVSLDAFAVAEPRASDLIGFLKAMEFTTLTKRVASELDAEAGEIEAIDVPVKHWDAPAKEEVPAASDDDAAGGGSTPEDGAAACAAGLSGIAIDNQSYETVDTMERLEAWIAEARELGHVGFDTETTSLDAMQADLAGFSLATVPRRACYVPVGHRGGSGDLLDSDADTPQQIPKDQALAALKDLLEDPAVLKVGQNLKYDVLVMRQHGVDVAPIDDTMLLSYVLDSGRGGHGMDDLSERHFGHKPISFKEVAGTGKSQLTFDQVPLGQATPYAAEDADVTLRLWQLLKPRLAAEAKATVYETLERPLISVLAQMERNGIEVDRTVLARLSGDFAQTMAGLEAEIHELAGKPFNIGSPKQLGEILFGEMGLEGGKKTATGAWSTGADVLDNLAAEGHDLPRKVLEWRQLSKLKSTYTDALPEFINPVTGRVHTSYAMASTSTGRLSSSDPNLQNIPVRTEEGRKIRTAFVAAKGSRLISADYSQIELRVLAHVADIPQLKQAFEDGLDIHAMTASEMFDTPIDVMDPMVRRRAKAINFGIIYGISAFGLANQLGIARSEAGQYIKTYFERFPGIKAYMDRTKAFAHEHGYVETIFGRRCHFPRIKSTNPSERAFQERAAINAPIQGSAADIIRRAMVRMPDALADAGLEAKILLQVHDELIFEAVEAEVERTMEVAISVMEGAAEPAVRLAVPIKVDARAAGNWDDAH
ncbi:MAG: DNA polymerase I [Pseudomonadota bacterium]